MHTGDAGGRPTDERDAKPHPNLLLHILDEGNARPTQEPRDGRRNPFEGSLPARGSVFDRNKRTSLAS